MVQSKDEAYYRNLDQQFERTEARRTVHHAGSVSVRFPASSDPCPEGNDPTECRECASENCHECGGFGKIEVEGVTWSPECPKCRGTGWLSAQLLGMEDPWAQQDAYRAERGMQP